MSALMDPETKSELVGAPRFRYHNVIIPNTFGVLWTAAGFGAVMLSFYIKITGKERQNGTWFEVLLLGISVILVGILTLANYFRRSREIVVNDDGIAALAFGRIWKFVRWKEMARIERVRRPMVTEWNTWRDGYEFVIRGRQNDEIRFVDKITCLTGLLSLLNRYVEQNHIPLVAFDRGSDSRQKIRAIKSDRGERKRLLREGYKTSLSSLTTQ